MVATIAIVGRPNVGKSTLFNRLIKRKAAITHDRPGVTRDRIVAELYLDERTATIIDTGGLMLESEPGGDIDAQTWESAKEAVTIADAILLVMDGREGLTSLDEQVAELVRRAGKPTLLAVNKVDGEEFADTALAEFHALGLTMLGVSAEHGYNAQTLREMIDEVLLEPLPPELFTEPAVEEHTLKLAVLGKPNAGKSSLVNAVIGEKRMIVSDVAGTTRDAVDVVFEKQGKRYTFVDTAGVRRRTKVSDDLERYTVMRALRSANRADVTLLVLDAEASVSAQDKKLLNFLDKEKVPFIVIINKADLLTQENRRMVMDEIERELRIVNHVPVLTVSALKKRGIGRILPTAEELYEECQIRVSTGELNRALRLSIDRHQPPLVRHKRAKFYYMTQAETNPPTFVFSVNDPERVKPSYKRYLENQLRKLFGLPHAPLRIHFRGR
jgi:GTP-binding protein